VEKTQITEKCHESVSLQRTANVHTLKTQLKSYISLSRGVSLIYYLLLRWLRI